MMERRRPIRYDLYGSFSYGVFDRIGTVALVISVLWIAPAFFRSANTATIPTVITAALSVLSLLLIGWFALLRNTVVVLDGRGIRSVVLGLTLRRISWSDVVSVTERSIGRGMKEVRIASGGSLGHRRRMISALSDLSQYSSLKAILLDQAHVYGFSVTWLPGQ